LGRRLVFRRSVPAGAGSGGRSGLRTIDVDGTRERWLRPTAIPLVSPDWSPDGMRIVAHAGRGSAHLWIVGVDGANPRRLGPRTLTGLKPRWSPDGGRLAFIAGGATTVRVLVLRTGIVRTVFDEESPYGQEFDLVHTWSPDGRWLAVMRTVSDDCVDDPTAEFCNHTELWIVHARGTRTKLVYTGPEHSSNGGIDWR
jgi:WD40 repeat protein